MQLKNKEQEVNEKLDIITNIIEEYGDAFSDVSREITMENPEYYWGGIIYCTHKKHTRIRIIVGFEVIYNTISVASGIDILFEEEWRSLGLFVKKNSTYNMIKRAFNEKNIRTNINIFIELMNEVDKLKPIYLYDKE